MKKFFTNNHYSSCKLLFTSVMMLINSKALYCSFQLHQSMSRMIGCLMFVNGLIALILLATLILRLYRYFRIYIFNNFKENEISNKILYEEIEDVVNDFIYRTDKQTSENDDWKALLLSYDKKLRSIIYRENSFDAIFLYGKIAFDHSPAYGFSTQHAICMLQESGFLPRFLDEFKAYLCDQNLSSLEINTKIHTIHNLIYK